ncbi:MAG: hypothetical protein U1F43_26485 [Myxococcota bacterium]
MRFLILLTFALSLGAMHSACGSCGEEQPKCTDCAIPKDGDLSKLPRTPAGVAIDDKVDVKKLKSRYRVVKPDEAGTGKIDFDFGDPNKLTGKISVSDAKGEEIVAKDVTPDESKYSLEWDVEADTTYILLVQATKAAAPYTLTFNVTPKPPPDPCANVTCEDDQECKEGRCIQVKVPECTPKCKGDKTCVNGECVAPCGGKCPSGQICNKRTNECVKDPCAGKTCPEGQRCSGGVCKDIPKATCPKCKDNETCNEKTAKCEKKPDVPAPTCNPACAADESCVNGACAKTPQCGPLGAGVIQVIPNGNASIVILNKGAGAAVKVGQTGRIGGVNGSFKITEVYPVRCKAVIDVDAATIGNNKGATINREACP